MTEPSDDRGGLERRDLLRGLGFGVVGSSVLAGNTAGQTEQSVTGELIDFAHLVPPGERPIDPERNTVSDTPDAGLDLVFQLDAPGMPKNEPRTIAYQMVLVTRDDHQVVTRAFEEGRTRGFAGTVRTTPGGETRRREEFSVAGLGPDSMIESPNYYWAVLMVSDLSALTAEGDGVVDFATVPFSVRHANQRQDEGD